MKSRSIQSLMLSFYILLFFLYLFAPKTAHRVVGYLEEEAVVSYTQYLAEVDEGRIEELLAGLAAIGARRMRD